MPVWPALTTPEDAERTVRIHAEAFEKLGLTNVLDRSAALVVQPGVEFGSSNNIPFEPAKAKGLEEWRNSSGGILSEAHSTDCQTLDALTALVEGAGAYIRIHPQGAAPQHAGMLVLSQFCSGLFGAIIAMNERRNGNQIHRRVST